MRLPRSSLVVCLTASVLAAVACHRDARPPGIVLVTVDTLRADRLGTYGWSQPTSPFIDGLAAASTVFEQAVPTCPATAPSIASLLTGHHRATHGVHRNGAVLGEHVVTIAERLRGAGWTTLARVTNPLLDTPRGFAQGFDVYSLPTDGADASDGARAVREVEKLLDGVGEQPFFLWLHLLDPHGPYAPPQSYQALFPPSAYARPGEADLPLSASNYGVGVLPRYQALGDLRAPADYRARYDAEIRYTDDNVKAVVGALQARGLWDRVIFVLTADHGESLGEHAYYFQHGVFAYDDSVRVPLVIHAAGTLPAGRRVEQTVSLIDVVPTLLELVALPPAPDVEGQSLMPLVRREEREHRAVFAQTYYGSGLTMLRLGGLKYILTPAAAPGARRARGIPPALVAPATERVELYDLAIDPAETEDVLRNRPRLATSLRKELDAWLDDQRTREQRAGAPDEPPADHGIEERLRALGYAD